MVEISNLSSLNKVEHILSKRGTGLIVKSHEKRLARRDEKRALILEFLSEVIFTSQPVIKKLLSIKSDRVALSTLERMENDGLVKIERTGCSNQYLVGITISGQAEIAYLLKKPFDDEHFSFRRSRDLKKQTSAISRVIEKITFFHLGLAVLKIAGWQASISSFSPIKVNGRYRVYSGIATSPEGESVCVMFEKEMSPIAHYKKILGECLLQISEGAYSRVNYVVRDARAVRALIQLVDFKLCSSLNAVIMNGDSVAITDGMLRKIKFSSIELFCSQNS